MLSPINLKGGPDLPGWPSLCSLPGTGYKCHWLRFIELNYNEKACDDLVKIAHVEN